VDGGGRLKRVCVEAAELSPRRFLPDQADNSRYDFEMESFGNFCDFY
jgi:hypothetical protein